LIVFGFCLFLAALTFAGGLRGLKRHDRRAVKFRIMALSLLMTLGIVVLGVAALGRSAAERRVGGYLCGAGMILALVQISTMRENR